MTYQLMATMAAGFEAIVAKELQALGYQTQTDNGRVYFQGEAADIIKTNLWLRTADRVMIIVKTFKAMDFTELFDQVNAIPWETYLTMDAQFPVTGRSVASKLHSVPDVQAITKKAIVQRLQDAYHRRSRLPETGALTKIDIRLRKNQAELLIDTTGDSLFKRGYRIDHGGAPLKENFAAGLIALTPWRANDPFLDPMTGSGTIAIEAALKARNIAPGLKRHFAFEQFAAITPEMVAAARAAAQAEIRNDLTLQIFANDIDETMIALAKVNAAQAGVLHDITFKQVAVKDFKTDLRNGIIIANPPYGKRLNDQKKAREIYADMGQAFRPLTTWSKYILTSDLEFQNFYGQRATKRRKLYNGYLRTDLFQYWGRPDYKNKSESQPG
ncbi:class I SAM-dependent RNA methyltransferase [Lapidilactobacillus achengensis]|uniref:Class I SAM-dependent RNA methyltransferase n=1 Tax=Lapidilactobacillus achengensis TaxID=2486000 RepID=A0ABW1UQC3_9LACO|nr:class I SAM-dependent RNA methyltransferase [Lapidilactobacillus achengensis]